MESSPNPFNPRTELRFEVPFDADATLALYDLRGQRVRTLHTGSLSAGPHDLEWDGKDDEGRDVASGVYVARLTQSGLESSLKVSLVR
jgi:flagellar hook assembly protein FlgD